MSQRQHPCQLLVTHRRAFQLLLLQQIAQELVGLIGVQLITRRELLASAGSVSKGKGNRVASIIKS